MKSVNGRVENGVLTVALSGHIDSSNAVQVEEEITALRQTALDDTMVLDMEALTYISSAGLRIILRILKQKLELKIVNASPEVYEILEMTGFTEMMTVEKAYRRLSVNGCEVIGQGANGKVYRLDPDTIIKVYFNPDSLPDIHRERELARRAFVLGVPTAIPYDVVKVDDGYGSVFELLNAKSLTQLITADPASLDEYARVYVELMQKIHGTKVKPGDMPDMKTVALDWADFLSEYLSPEQDKKLHDLIRAVPEDFHMLHGDYHIKNVMVQDGEALLIDMDTLCMGHPVFEFASIFLAYLGFGELDHTIMQDFLGISYETAGQIWEKTLRLYFGTDDQAKLDAIADKAKVIGYARLLRRTIRRNGFSTNEGRAIIENCKVHLTDLLSRVDSLCFNTGIKSTERMDEIKT